MKTKLSTRNCAASFAQVLSVGAVGLLAGCASYPESHVVSAPPPPPPAVAPPAQVYSAPASTVAVTPDGRTVAYPPSPVGASSVVVMQAPPQAQQEIATPRPSRDHMWVSGYWTWRNDRYEWIPGHWEVPPRVGASWVPPRWQQEGTAWRFYEGYWD
jgi:hypothetical protein